MSRVELGSVAEALVRAAQRVSPTVRLVGGSGLGLLLGHRRSDDIDLFAERGEPLSPIVNAVTAAAEPLGAVVTHVRTTPSFVRLEVALRDTTVRVDIAQDASERLEPTGTRVGDVYVESLRDQRANKLVAVLGRSELRDLVDLYFLEAAGLPAIEGIEDALQKDGGVDPAWLAWAIDQINITPLPGMVVPLNSEELSTFRGRLREQLLDRSGAGID